MPRKYVRRKPLPTKEWTEQKIDEYYTKRRVKDSILNIEIDKSRDDSISMNDLRQIYWRYGINYYATKRDFVTSMKENTKDITDDMIEEMWKAYKHRDALIRTGQYQEERTRIFRDNYLKSLNAIGTPDRVLDALRAIPLKQWDTVANIPNPDKSSPSITKLPHLGRFAYSTKGGDERDPSASEIWRDVLTTFGIDPDDMQQKIDYDAEVKYFNDITREYEEAWGESKKRMKAVIRLIPKPKREEINRNSIDDYEESILSLVEPTTKKGKKRVKWSKKGYFYIPFVGSQNPKSKNAQIVSNIVNEFRGRQLKYSDFVEGWDDTSEK